MKKILFTSLWLALALISIITTTEQVHAWECFTSEVFLKDYQAKVKWPLYMRDWPCSDERTNKLETLWNNEVVTVIASNHWWLKVKKANGAIWWIWWPGWVLENLTTDQYSDNTYISQKWYWIDDTHLEFAHILNNGNIPSNDDYTDTIVVTTPVKTYNISSSMKSQLDNLLTRVYAIIEEKSDTISGQKKLYEGLILSLRRLKSEKAHLADILSYLIDKISMYKEAL